MSAKLIARSPDLKRLRDDGFDLEIKSGFLIIRNVPYVNSRREVMLGKLVSELTLCGDVTSKPSTHVVHFAGDHPCHKDGSEIAQIKHGSARNVLGPDLVVDHSFSNKPREGFGNYYDKIMSYATIISGPAEALDPRATARTFPLIEPDVQESPFNYLDTASSRAEIGLVSQKLALGKIAIIGVGGTGSYILDLVAKTPVREIHLFDGDVFSQHNAFRAPGAASAEELRQKPKKVAYLKERYSKLHRGIVAHDAFLDAGTVEQLRCMDFVFLSLDQGDSKRLVIEKLEEFGVRFIDVGMGLQLVDGALLGVLRVSTSTPQQRAHIKAKNRIPLSDGNANNEYSKNVQIADLNALNAALAVIKWKKLCGFYKDLENEHFSAFTIDGNALLNEDQA